MRRKHVLLGSMGNVPDRRRPRRAGRRAVGQLVVVVGFMAAWLLPAPASASPGAGMYPGAALLVGNEMCTAGFVVRNQRGVNLMLTAGHCDVGGPVRASSAGSWVPAAEFVASSYLGQDGDDPDIAVMKPAGTVDLSSAVGASLPVAGYVPMVYDGLKLCKWGAATGRSCGPVIESSPTKVKFAARVAPGDSGGPVWAYLPSGAAVGVGITIRQSATDGYPVAELIGPWLDRWQLNMAT